jgi:hypothetical protein
MALDLAHISSSAVISRLLITKWLQGRLGPVGLCRPCGDGARGRRWLREIVDDAKANVENIATRENCRVLQVNMTISLAFLAPDIVKGAIDGRLPRGIGITRLRDAPIEWSRQHAMLGLPG